MRLPGRQRAMLVLLTVYLAGGVTGLALEEWFGDLAWVERLEGDEEPEELEDIEEGILDELGLSGTQEEAVERIMDAREERLEAYWQARLPDIRGIIESTRTEIRNVLTAEQRRTYDRRVGELEDSADGTEETEDGMGGEGGSR